MTALNIRTFAKYGAFARVGFAAARAEPAELAGRVVFFFVILGVFSALWRAVGQDGGGAAAGRSTMVWYLAITEWVLLSAPMLHFEIEAEVRRGDVAYQIARPVSYVGAHVARGIGTLALRAPVLLITAYVGGLLFAGQPPHSAVLARVIALGLVATAIVTTYHVAFGLLAFWLGDIAPVYWIWQKLSFVLGGLLLPLTYYPDIVNRVAVFTPFPALLMGPASFMLDRPFFQMPALAGLLVFWLVVGSAAATMMFRRAARTLQLNGG
jgi:ABC-2 type transport system permease protein